MNSPSAVLDSVATRLFASLLIAAVVSVTYCTGMLNRVVSYPYRADTSSSCQTSSLPIVIAKLYATEAMYGSKEEASEMTATLPLHQVLGVGAPKPL